MAKKKKNEPIVIDKTPLIPTTIGMMEEKENGPIVAIIWIFLFIACIVGLPYITDYVNNLQANPPVTTEPPVVDDDPDDEAPVAPDEEVVYYDLNSTTKINVGNYQVDNLLINGNQLTLTIHNLNDATGSMFLENDYYIELYGDDLTLLQRIKIANTAIVSTQTISYDISAALQLGTPTKIIITEKSSIEYPQVSLVLNEDDLPILTCFKQNETIEYIFKSETEYQLQSLKRTYSYDATNADYNDVLTRYTTLSATYSTLRGVSSSLIPIASGFTFDLDINLTEISEGTYRQTFTDSIYYPLDTEAKVIAFELETSGYTCN